MTTEATVKNDDAPPRPVVAYRDGWIDRIPAELKARRHWIVWQPEYRPAGPKSKKPAKWTKVLYQPQAPVNKAMPNTPGTWNTFKAALKAFNREPDIFSGVGYVFSPQDPYTGIDLDNCLDELGRVLEWAAPIVARLAGTYAEISPSGRGIKFWVRAKLPGAGTRKEGLGPDGTGAIELYDRNRFFTVTGNAWQGEPTPIVDLQAVVDDLYRMAHDNADRKRGGKANGHHASNGNGHQDHDGGQGNGVANGHHPAAPAGGGVGHAHAHALLDDVALLARARSARNGAKFVALYDRGEVPAGGSESQADMALCDLLAFWTGRDAGRMESLWLASALGERGKVRERADYRARTIAEAIAGCQEVYSPEAWRRAGPAVGEPLPLEARDAIQLLDANDYPWTDMGLAKRVAHYFGDQIRYCYPWRKWLAWDGRRWKVDDTGEASRKVKQTVDLLRAEAESIHDSEARDKFEKWALTCQGNRAHDAALNLVRSERRIHVLPEALDRDGWSLNVLNGTVDLRTGELRPHRREEMLTKLAPVEFDSAARCDLWEKTLSTIFGRDTDMLRFIQALCGYCLTGQVGEQILPILYGTGANGKSTVINVLLAILGPDYAMKANPELLLVKRHDGHPTERADLHGKRLAVAIETGEGQRLNEPMIKELTGGDRIRCRRMREDFWEYDPTHKILLCTNHMPRVKGGDHAVWRRIRKVPFAVTIAEKDQDKHLGEKLQREMPGILGWCVRGCLSWQADGLQAPQSVIDATEEYRRDEDILGRFLAERFESNPSKQVPFADMYLAYQLWCIEGDMKPASKNMIGRKLETKGIKRFKSNSVVYCSGIDLTAEARDALAARQQIPFTTG
jgi:putative DNA primase/helicase